MAIATYTQLQTSIADWLERADLDSRIPDFIALAEAKFNRDLFVRQMEVRSTTVVDTGSTEPEMISLPADFQSMRRVRLSSVTGKPCLEFKSGVQMDEYRFGTANVTAQPRYFTIFGTEMELVPTPGSNYTIEMIYRANVPPLSANATNWLLSLAPDLYLYGTLLEAAPYAGGDKRIELWAAGYSDAMTGLNQLGLTSTFNAGPMRMTVSGFTP